MDYLSIVISLVVLFVSVLTFWLTRIKNGVVKMTRPTVIFFGTDYANEQKKIFLRTLLYSTSDKGKYVQYMFVRLQRGESVQNFNIWTYGDDGLVRGSGLFINKNGVAHNHNFRMPKDGSAYDFLPGEYMLQVFVETIDEKPKKIFEQRLTVTKNQVEEMKSKRFGLYFDWAPNSQDYFSHVGLH